MKNALVIVVVGLGAIVVGSILISVPVMLLWNWLMPILFGLKTISFFEALGLSVLCSLLFKSSGSSSSSK